MLIHGGCFGNDVRCPTSWLTSEVVCCFSYMYMREQLGLVHPSVFLSSFCHSRYEWINIFKSLVVWCKPHSQQGNATGNCHRPLGLGSCVPQLSVWLHADQMTSVFVRKVKVNSFSGASPPVTWSPHIQQCSFILRWCSLILFCLKLAVTKEAAVQRGYGVAREFGLLIVSR